MNCISKLLVWILCLPFLNVVAQDSAIKKSYEINFTDDAPKIDGVLDDIAWQNANIATDFIEFEPNPGIPAEQKTELKLVYDNEAIYVGVMMYDNEPVNQQLSERDRLNNADFIGVVFDTYQDEQNGFEFVVSAAGVQFDAKFGPNGEDDNWDAVWSSDVSIVSEGWIAEMKIPYSAIRFGSDAQQTWGVNFFRRVGNSRQKHFWNKLDPEVSGFLTQFGELSGIENIEAPVRLSVSPFVLFSENIFTNKEATPFDTQSDFQVNGGMDLKYGINDAFTLDMILIPDFAQAKSDDEVLNLSPFETRFDENRPFFTEGTELFNKAGLFYSRRVGNRPIGFWDVEDHLEENEVIKENPIEGKLINATKVSGRTQNGLGIGVFNAISKRMHAIVGLEGSESMDREILTGPLTNYNVLVFDQSLKNSSSITFTNTNVWREGSYYDANVTGLHTNLRDKNQKYRFGGHFVYNRLADGHLDDEDTGHRWGLFWSKASGSLNYGINLNEESHDYNPNDLGFLFNNNERNVNGWMSYNIYEPFGIFNRMGFNFNTGYSRLHKPNEFANYWVNINAWTNLKSFHGFGIWATAEPVITYDWFEPRQEGRAYTYPKNYNVGGWFSSNYNKTFAIDLEANYRTFSNSLDQSRFNYEISPRVKIGDNMLLIYEYSQSIWPNDVGYAETLNNDDIIFGIRDRDFVYNELEAKYIFNNNMSFGLIGRHNWSKAEYTEFRILDQEGLINQVSDYTGLDEDGVSQEDVNFNAFNVDASFNWRFAPGSDLTAVWKNSILDFDRELEDKFGTNFNRNVLDANQTNNFSLKLVYYLDYLTAKSKLTKS